MDYEIRDLVEDDIFEFLILTEEMHASNFEHQHVPFHPKSMGYTLLNRIQDPDFFVKGAFSLKPKDGKYVAGDLIGFWCGEIDSFPWNFHKKRISEQGVFVTKSHRGSRAVMYIWKEFIKWCKEKDVDHVEMSATTGFYQGYPDKFGKLALKHGFEKSAVKYSLSKPKEGWGVEVTQAEIQASLLPENK